MIPDPPREQISLALRVRATQAKRRAVYQALIICSGFFLSILHGRLAQAQQATPSPQPSARSLSPQELAKSVHNPFEDFIKVPIESETDFGLRPHHNVGNGLNIQPLIPFRLTSRWDLIAQPSFTVTYQPSPHEEYGLDDSQLSLFITPHGIDKWLWGAGPIFQFPSATATQLGAGRWCAGPTAALVYSQGPWFNGVLVYQLMSFAGDQDRGSVNQTFIEPQISYSFESGWYVDTNPSITFDWTADAGNGWTLPVGADIGKAFNIGSQAMSLQVGSYDLIERPGGNPQWLIRMQMTLLFPTGK